MVAFSIHGTVNDIMSKSECSSNNRPTPAPADSGSAAEGKRRLARSVRNGEGILSAPPLPLSQSVVQQKLYFQIQLLAVPDEQQGVANQ